MNIFCSFSSYIYCVCFDEIKFNIESTFYRMDKTKYKLTHTQIFKKKKQKAKTFTIILNCYSFFVICALHGIFDDDESIKNHEN